ncbi:MAG: NAD(P)-binding domain-containing protein [Polyangia bacterium]
MTERSLGFIGGGRIARILLGGCKRAGRLPERIVVSDSDSKVLADLQAQFAGALTTTADIRQPAAQDLVLLALHPPAFPAVLAAIKDVLRPGAIVISLAPKWSMGRIASTLGAFGRLARSIPNAPSIVNAGYNPICFGSGLDQDGRDEITRLFEIWGACPVVPEETLEAHAIVSAMGPTYLWYQLYQLIELAQQCGLTPAAAQAAVLAMAQGAARTMSDAGMPPHEVMDLVPVKPLAALEPTVKEAYATVLQSLYRKLKEP